MKRTKRSMYYTFQVSLSNLSELNRTRHLAEIKDIWREMAALDMLLANKRAYVKCANKARTRQKEAYFLALAENASVLIRLNAHWYRRFDRYLAGGHIRHAYKVLKVMAGCSREQLEFTPVCWHIV